MPSLNLNNNLYPQMAPLGYDEVYDKLVVGTARDKFRDEFFSLDPAVWETVQTGAGMTVSVAGATSGSRYLNIASGTTINSETILQTRGSFLLPSKLAVGLSMSQRIANTEVYVELVGVNAAGVVETDSTFASPNVNNALNAVGFKFDSTNANNAIYTTRGFGTSELVSAPLGFSNTAATGTGPNFLAQSIFEISADIEEVFYAGRSIDSHNTQLNAVKRTQNTPDPTKRYKVRLRVKNLGTAPASSTDVRFHFVRVLDSARLTVDFSKLVGRSGLADALPVAISGNPVINTFPSVPTVTTINSAATTNATAVSGTAATLTGLYATNIGATAAFVKLYNKATAPTVGTDVPVAIIVVPAAVSGIPGVAQFNIGPNGYRFATGVGLAITGAMADTDTTAVAAGQVKVILSRV